MVTVTKRRPGQAEASTANRAEATPTRSVARLEPPVVVAYGRNAELRHGPGSSRLERGTFAWPADVCAAPVELRSSDLLVLLAGVEVSATRRRRLVRSRVVTADRF